MQKPHTAQLIGFDEYWKPVHEERDVTGKLPFFVFDFISIHRHYGYKEDGSFDFGFCSPMCLVDEKTGKRPDFENEKYKTKAEAVRRGRELARQYKTWLVDCTGGY
jgi:hypothetical protein